MRGMFDLNATGEGEIRRRRTKTGSAQAHGLQLVSVSWPRSPGYPPRGRSPGYRPSGALSAEVHWLAGIRQ